MSRLTTAPALAALLAAAALTLAACGGDAADTPSDEAPSTEAATLELSVAATPAGRCMVPNVDNLKSQDTAFEGVVTSVAEGTATLDVTEAYKGTSSTTAAVSAPSQDLQDLLIAVDFEEGQTYLVSSLDGQVSLCGLGHRQGHRQRPLQPRHRAAIRQRREPVQSVQVSHFRRPLRATP
jgi:hypothetical protein